MVKILRFPASGFFSKKVQVVWQDMEIESVGELYYACNENRLMEAKGFGLKTQEDIKKAIEFAMANQGWYHFAKVMQSAEKTIAALRESLSDSRISYTGDFRRKAEVLQEVELLSDAPQALLLAAVTALDHEMKVEAEQGYIQFRDENSIPFKLFFCEPDLFAKMQLLTTGSKQHIAQLEALGEIKPLETEDAIYASLGLAYVEPELREGGKR